MFNCLIIKIARALPAVTMVTFNLVTECQTNYIGINHVKGASNHNLWRLSCVYMV